MSRLVAVLCLAAALALSSAAQAEQFIRIGSGVAGTYPVMGAKIADLINKNIEGVQASTVAGGTEANLVKLQKGEIEMMLTYAFLSRLVVDGKGALGVPVPDVRHMMTLYGSFLQPVGRNGSGVTSLAQADDSALRIWGANRTSIFYPMIESALAAHGVTFEGIKQAGGVVEGMGYRDSVQAMQDGRLDIGFFAGPAPYGLLMQIQDRPGFTVLGFSDEAAGKMSERLPGVSSGTMPAGTYTGQDEAVTLPYMTNQLVVSARLSDDLAYRITKLLNENTDAFHGLFKGAEEITPERALLNNPIELHPGAARFYREAGLLK